MLLTILTIYEEQHYCQHTDQSVSRTHRMHCDSHRYRIRTADSSDILDINTEAAVHPIGEALATKLTMAFFSSLRVVTALSSA